LPLQWKNVLVDAPACQSGASQLTKSVWLLEVGRSKMERIWDKFLTDQDKAVMRAAGYGARGGYGQRPALLVIDVTYGFTGDRPEPILDSIKRWSSSCGAASWDAIPVIQRLIAAFRAKRLPVIYTAHGYRPDNWDAGGWQWKNTRMDEEGGSNQPEGYDFNGIVAELAPAPQDILIVKQKPSAFYGTNLAAYLNLLGADSVVVVGTTTSGCVRATVLDAFSNNIRSTVIEDGCFDRCEASHAINLFDMDAKYADVVSASDVHGYLASLPDNLFPHMPSGRPVQG